MNSNWHGLVKIDLIQHVRDGKVLWEQRNLLNTLHSLGEQFLLTAAFNNDGTVVPVNYYFGLDDRTEITVDDTIDDLLDEPSTNGYSRVAISSSGGFTLQQVGGIWRAVSGLLQFTSTGAGYGPVKNLFLTTEVNNSGVLIASNALSSAVTLTGGDTINLRMSLQLRDALAV